MESVEEHQAAAFAVEMQAEPHNVDGEPGESIPLRIPPRSPPRLSLRQKSIEDRQGREMHAELGKGRSRAAGSALRRRAGKARAS